LQKIDRRLFLGLSTGALMTSVSKGLLAATDAPGILSDEKGIRVKAATYAWEYAASDDSFRLLDAQGWLIVSGRLQPVVIVAPQSAPAQRTATSGKLASHVVNSNSVTFLYEAVNGGASIAMTWRFDQDSLWTDPITYDDPASNDVVSLHYFSYPDGAKHSPSLHSSYLIVPGIGDSTGISPIVFDTEHLDGNVWLGRGSFIPGLFQQWALPLHYFSGFSRDDSGAQVNTYTRRKSAAYTCGLADLPAGDLFLQMYEGSASPWIDYRSDIWHHLRTPGPVTLGATWLWTIAPDFYEATAAYYQRLLQQRMIHKQPSSAHKAAVTLAPEFCTWGAQRTRNKTEARLDETFLNELYGDLKASGMQAKLFSIDDKWEGKYGNLEHSSERLPHFEQFLDQLRADGFYIGFWAALMRCETPADIGLSAANMLQGIDGKPYLTGNFGRSSYYILDFTQPTVEKVFTELVRRFVRRYKPDLIKFDFGYELPPVGVAAPSDKHWSGERLMWKGIDVAVKAMRAENPDIVVMYYNLSPLFLDYFDLHAPDDLFMVPGDYDVEANRRFYFSSLLGRLGVPTYGSSGYDWASSPAIWFDSAAVGTIGSLNDFPLDEEGESSSPQTIALYNGITKTLRPTTTFEIVPLGIVPIAPSRGANPRSWARLEGGQLTLLAWRPPIPGETNPLASTSSDPRIRDAVGSLAPVIVSSRGNLGIARARQLAVVAYGPGEIVIRRDEGRQAEIISHYFGGSAVTSQAQIDRNELKLSPALDHVGNPLEWIEINIA
jgi:hypothetical protein